MVLFSTKRKSDYTSNRNISIMKPNTGRANLPYKSEFILEIIDGRELPEYMTMNKGKICG